MPRVYNKRIENPPKDAIYVGRPTIYGNPYSHIGQTAAKFFVPTRKEAIERYTSDIVPELLAEGHIEKLRGKDLVCWCAPKSCHADVLLKLANEMESES